VLLASPGSEVLSTIFLKSMEAESLSATSALAVYIIAILFAVIVISQRSFRFYVQ
jgi:ABC-type Fe3+ transport system permease subunit